MDLMSHSSSFLLPSIPPNSGPTLTYALVVLNQPLPRFTPLLWKHAQLRLCADGGANRLYDEMPALLPHEDLLDVRHRYKPDIIKGDMDSIRPEVQEFYIKLGTEVVDESYDQDTTDLHKCVNFILDCTPNMEKSNLRILVSGALGGRFDHELLPKTRHHEIHIQSSVEGPHCGLIPIGEPSASTTTTGLQWDLTDTAMKFGGLVSTSNIVREEKITVRSDSDLLWTISIRKLK
ncbi:hypothetical protein AAC387_Pa03g2099 [Persea americana]